MSSMIDKDLIGDFDQSSWFDSSDESEDLKEFIAVQQTDLSSESGRKRTIYSLKQHMGELTCLESKIRQNAVEEDGFTSLTADGIVERWETGATQAAKVAGHQETSSVETGQILPSLLHAHEFFFHHLM
ncbi:hypothetical protein BDR26DRAFT_890796 [Obelidium mucronatum]|nr:hypothetical protein BDR26DRAFT_890796 [Obelidium mucronatum]